MAASTKLSLKDVVKALDKLTTAETQELVIRFGVERHDLVDMQTQHNPKICFIEAWLDRDMEASWEKIVSGLQEIKKAVLAKEIATRHCPESSPPSTDPSNSATALAVQPVSTTAEAAPATPSSSTASAVDSVPPPMSVSDPTQPLSLPAWSVAKVKATILQLEERFSDLIADAEDEIGEKENQDRRFLKKFRTRLLLLPVSKKPSHAKFFHDSEDEILKATTTQKLVAILCRYLNYRNYEILVHIIERFCDAPLQKSMQEYCKMLEEFEMATTVDVYICSMPHDKELEVAFSKMVMKIDKPSTKCTLYEIRMLNETLAKESSVCSHSVYVSSVTTNCVVVVVRFPSSAAGWVMAAMTPDFMHTHHLIEVALDGKRLTVIKGDVWPTLVSVLILHCWRYDGRVFNGRTCMLYVWTGVETATSKWGGGGGSILAKFLRRPIGTSQWLSFDHTHQFVWSR